MRKRPYIIIACSLAALLTTLVLTVAPSHVVEPVYEGKPASHWILYFSRPAVLPPVSELTHDLPGLHLDPHLELSSSSRLRRDTPTPSVRFEPEPENQSVIAIRAMGSNAVPALLSALRSDNREMEANAANLLGQVGPIDEVVASALVRKMLISESRIHRTYRSVWQSLPLIKQHLKKPDFPQPFSRRFSDPWFSRAHPSYNAFGQLLFRARSLPSTQSHRPNAILKVIPDLTGALSSKEDWQVEFSATILGAVGFDAQKSIPKLVHEFQNQARDLEVRVATAQAIGRIDPTSPYAFNAFKETIYISTNRVVKCAAVAAIGKSAPGNTSAVILLESLWHGEDGLLSCLAYDGLRHLDPKRLKGTVPPELSPGANEFGGTSGVLVDVVYAGPFPKNDYLLFQRFRSR